MRGKEGEEVRGGRGKGREREGEERGRGGRGKGEGREGRGEGNKQHSTIHALPGSDHVYCMGGATCTARLRDSHYNQLLCGLKHANYMW